MKRSARRCSLDEVDDAQWLQEPDLLVVEGRLVGARRGRAVHARPEVAASVEVVLQGSCRGQPARDLVRGRRLLWVEVDQHDRPIRVASEVLRELVGVEVLASHLGEVTGAADGAGGMELLEVFLHRRQQGRVALGVGVQAAQRGGLRTVGSVLAGGASLMRASMLRRWQLSPITAAPTVSR